MLMLLAVGSIAMLPDIFELFVGVLIGLEAMAGPVPFELTAATSATYSHETISSFCIFMMLNARIPHRDDPIDILLYR